MQLELTEDELETIDAAALCAGQTRDEFIRSATVERARGNNGARVVQVTF